MKPGMAAVFAAIFLESCASAAPSLPVPDALARLQEGGRVVLMRHANSPSGQHGAVGMTAGCVLQPGRGLDAEGFRQARAIGAYLAREGALFAAGHTSDMCRAYDTARLVAAGAPVAVDAALKSTDTADLASFKKRVEASLAAAQRGNLLVVTHSNIVPLLTDWRGEGEIPSGLLLVIEPRDWSIAGCLDFSGKGKEEPAMNGDVCAGDQNR